jgi:hypothetical protein
MAKHRTTDSLAKSGYVVSDTTLAQIAREYVDIKGRAEGVRGTYLKILVAHAQRELGRKRGTDDVLLAIETVHQHLYDVVLQAITTKDIAPAEDLEASERTRRALERNRRTTFARTAKSVLTSWVRAGGKIEKLVPKDVRKDELQKLYQPAQIRRNATIKERATRVEKKLESLVRRMIDEDPVAAQAFLEKVQARLTAIRPRRSVRRPNGAEIRAH